MLSSVRPHDPAARLVRGSVLNAVLFDRDDTTQKRKWSNLPTRLYERSGLAIGDMTDAHVTAFLGVMEAMLSTGGYQRVVEEWNADQALADSSGGGGGGLNVGTQYYYVAAIGEPSATESWQWQFGGHHVTTNATIHGDDLSLMPSIIGAQLTSYNADGQTVRPVGDIDDEAFALVQSLDGTQQGQAVLAGDYIDLVLGLGEDCKTIQAPRRPAPRARGPAAALRRGPGGDRPGGVLDPVSEDQGRLLAVVVPAGPVRVPVCGGGPPAPPPTRCSRTPSPTPPREPR